MKSKHNIHNQISLVSRIELSPTDKKSLWDKIEHQIENPNQVITRPGNAFWKRRTVSVATMIACLFLGMGTVAWGSGVNVLQVTVQFVHNITSGGAYGAGYGLEDTTVSLTLKGPSSAIPANNNPSKVAEKTSDSAQPSHAMSTTQMTSDGSLFDTGYNTQLDNYLGTNQYPKLMGANVAVNHIQAYAIDRSKGIFYMRVGGYVPGNNEQTIYLDVYHKTGGTVVINGQTVANFKQQVNVSGIDATYVAFTNNKTTLNYLTWKSGDWIFVLRSNDVSEPLLTKYAKGVQSQVKVN